ncbi:hypothetical protein R3W88_021391 [Solanum pinnatisectum]|uniref:Leucine-rich repeat-containing N-terminal plant-type domain-containing protein n=1 Tax=Solanum pinnatisectum TaxID=50273 RepID=A0AAV9LSG0_9SOLN|nr:hypothetical protein R3W88_021391 [Solanum pinnatisectum]
MEYQKLIMAFCFHSLFILIVQQSQLTYAGKHLCASDEAFYLLQLKQGLTVDPNAYHYGCDSEAEAKTLSWNATRDCCEWGGLDLSSSCLRGTINANSSLKKLGHLQRLNLAFNKLSDFPLGNSISELSSLTHLNLSHSGFMEGEMQIPAVLSNLSKLVSLDLSWHFTEFQFGPTTFTSLLQDLTNLEVLLLNNMNIFGNISELPKNLSSSLSESQIFHLLNLQVLRLGSNPSLTGTLPNFNWSYSGSIVELDFSNTGIFGKVPDSIGNLHSLLHLNLFNCHLSGSIPESLGNLTAIRELILTGNNFTGNVPSTISKLNKLVYLDLSSNHFRFQNLLATSLQSQRNVPSTIRKLNKLSYLSLSSNNFEGLIPDIFANFSELSFLDFDTNNFTGPLPYSIATLTRLESLYLQNNSLTGPLPSNISGLQELQILDLSFNYFTGTTPPWLFHLPSLLSLYVQDNQLTGKLPNELKSNYLEYFNIDLSHNKLQGKIPDWIFSTSVGRLDLSHNFLPGFKKQVWHSGSLQHLNLENNFLQGTLHQSFCDLINLEFLILAQNNFSGSIPDCLGNSNSVIYILDLRMNNFHGEIPGFLLTQLQYLGLYGNQLRGQVLLSLVNCTNLEALDLGDNKINDTFPIWLEKLPNLQVLILKSNLFHGTIDDLELEFSFPELRIFDLSFNGFTGTLSSNLFKKFRGMMDVDEENTGIT